MEQKPDRYARFFSLSLDMFCIAGVDGYFKELSPSWEKTLGLSRQELCSKPWLDFVHPEDRQSAIAAQTKLSGGAQTIAFENRCLCKNGQYKWLLWHATPIPEENLIYAVARDITDQKEERARLQAQFLRAQKMEVLGKLAGGVAHDFNNLLTAISGYSHFLLQSLAPGDPNRADIEEIKNAGERASLLTSQLLAFSRPQVFQPKIMDLNDIVRDVEKMLRRLIGEDISLVSVLGSNLGKVKADPGQIEQIILNIAVNARDAMPKGGKMTLETNNIALDKQYAQTHPEIKPGPYVMLSMSDTGCGMDAKTLSRIFEPFFTTKEQGKGAGLGLAALYEIVKQSGGSVFVCSEPGKGSAFQIYLPKVPEETQLIAAGPASHEPFKGSETILLVEDDDMVRKFIRRLLLANGYKLLEASSPNEAIQLSQQHKDQIHLLMTDIVMPGMRGDELANRFSRARPEMKVIFTSGYTEMEVVGRGPLGPGKVFIQKPISPEEMLRKVREVLDKPAIPKNS